METVDVTMQVPKEIKEIVDLLDGILQKVMAKAPIADYAGLIDEAMLAADGVTGVSEEVKSAYRDEAAGYLVHKLLGTLLPVT